MILGGPPTVKGDDRMTNFKTSHSDQFQGKWEKPVQTLPAVSDPVRLREGVLLDNSPITSFEISIQLIYDK